MKSEWEKLCEKFLFDFGKHVLGKNSGGVILKLKQSRGIDAAWIAIKMAAEKSDPKEYIGAVLRQKPQPSVSQEEIDAAMERYRQRRIREGWI